MIGWFWLVQIWHPEKKSLAFQKMLFASQIEASPDGILVVSNKRKWLSFNHRFLEMWQIPEQVAATGESQVALQTVKEQLENPEQFLARIEELYKYPDEQAHDESLRGSWPIRQAAIKSGARRAAWPGRGNEKPRTLRSGEVASV
jgi:hypothetical protein